MAEGKQTTRNTRSTARDGDPAGGFTAEERAAMRERTAEMRAAARRKGAGSEAEGEADVLAKIAEMPEADRHIAEQLHSLIRQHAPELSSRTWYGMPAYAKDGNVLCYYQGAYKFKSRYGTLGFSDKAHLDDGELWPVTFALKEMTPAVKEKIVQLMKVALG